MKLYWRFVFVWMAFTGLILVYMMRVNLSVAIVGMVNSTVYKPKNFTPECPITFVNESQNAKPTGEFMWSEDEQALLLSSFYWGYTIMQVPSGILMLFFDGKWIYGLSTLTTAILTFFIPLAAYLGLYFVIVLRFLMGICEGPTFPALYALCGRWILNKETSVVMTVILSGTLIGTILGQSLTGLIIQQYGWKYVFYLMGTFGCVWFIAYALLVFDKPTNHPFISEYEKQLLVNSIPHNQPSPKVKRLRIPWRKIITSRPYIGYLIFAAAYNFTWYTMINCLPMYIGTVLGFNISQNGAISSLPYICLLIFSVCGSASQDYIKSKNIISTTKIRKIFGCTGMLISAVLMYSVIFTGCHIPLTISLVCLSVAFLGLSGTVNAVNILDLAPVYAGTLQAIVNIFNSLCGIISPIVKNFFTRLGETRDNWENVFITSSSILFVGSFVYLFFGSATLQPWAIVDNKTHIILGYEILDNDYSIDDDQSHGKDDVHIQ